METSAYTTSSAPFFWGLSFVAYAALFQVELAGSAELT